MPAQKHAGEDRALRARRKEPYKTARTHRPERWVRNTTRTGTPVTSTTLHPIDSKALEPLLKKNPPALVHGLARHHRCRREQLRERSGHLGGKVFASAGISDHTQIVLRILPDWVDSCSADEVPERWYRWCRDRFLWVSQTLPYRTLNPPVASGLPR
jgi:hypothetical protein